MNALSLFNSLFDTDMMQDFNVASALPRVDVRELKDSYIVDVDLPGYEEKDIDLQLKDHVLTIASDKREEEKKFKDGEGWIIKERSKSSFNRRFTLPQDIDETGVSACFKDGVLSITLKRKALTEPKRIAISVA